jgi:hypothetical protein
MYILIAPQYIHEYLWLFIYLNPGLIGLQRLFRIMDDDGSQVCIYVYINIYIYV